MPRSRAQSSREAYRAGAKHVLLLYGDLHLRKAEIELGPEEELGWSAPHLLDLYHRAYDERPALVSLTGNPDPDLLGRSRRGPRRPIGAEGAQSRVARARRCAADQLDDRVGTQ